MRRFPLRLPVGWIDWAINPQEHDPTDWKLPAGWTWCQGPVDAPPPLCTDGPSTWLGISYFGIGSCSLVPPLYGQGGDVVPFGPQPGLTPIGQPGHYVAFWAGFGSGYLLRNYVDCNGFTAHTVVEGTITLDGSKPWWEVPSPFLVPSHFTPIDPDPGIELMPQPEYAPRYPGVPLPQFAPTPWIEIPLWKPDPNAAPSERTDRGPAPARSPVSDPDPRTDGIPGLGPGPGGAVIVVVPPRADTTPGAETGSQPDAATSPGGAMRSPVYVPSPNYFPSPPRPGERQRKEGLGKGTKYLIGLADKLTESQDALDALHKALPKHLQAPPWSDPLTRDQQVWKHWKQVDLRKALKELVKNEVEDRAYGAIGKARAATQKKRGRPHYEPNPDRHRPAFADPVGDALDPFNDFIDSL